MLNIKVSAIDLFCGAGGLSYGLKSAGVDVVAGIDIDPSCRFPYEHNVGARFIEQSVRDISGSDLLDSWGEDFDVRLLAGCAPCQPFSSQRRGKDTSLEEEWDLLREFSRLVDETKPDYVTMENVAPAMKSPIFKEFLSVLNNLKMKVDYGILSAHEYGLPQARKRLVLIASKGTDIKLPQPDPNRPLVTVGQALSGLKELSAGESDPLDPLHKASKLSDLNFRRRQASRPGGSWRDWPVELRSECHTKQSGKSFEAFYGVLDPDKPAPTITTQFYNYGSGRFGHPTELRAITPREASILQGFPRSYQFVPDGKNLTMKALGKMIGNAVPPIFGKLVGTSVIESAAHHRQ